MEFWSEETDRYNDYIVFVSCLLCMEAFGLLKGATGTAVQD
jgi:hypothetical protein